jgi:hypothetical protein
MVHTVVMRALQTCDVHYFCLLSSPRHGLSIGLESVFVGLIFSL